MLAKSSQLPILNHIYRKKTWFMSFQLFCSLPTFWINIFWASMVRIITLHLVTSAITSARRQCLSSIVLCVCLPSIWSNFCTETFKKFSYMRAVMRFDEISHLFDKNLGCQFICQFYLYSITLTDRNYSKSAAHHQCMGWLIGQRSCISAKSTVLYLFRLNP